MSGPTVPMPAAGGASDGAQRTMITVTARRFWWRCRATWPTRRGALRRRGRRDTGRKHAVKVAGDGFRRSSRVYGGPSDDDIDVPAGSPGGHTWRPPRCPAPEPMASRMTRRNAGQGKRPGPPVAERAAVVMRGAECGRLRFHAQAMRSGGLEGPNDSMAWCGTGSGRFRAASARLREATVECSDPLDIHPTGGAAFGDAVVARTFRLQLAVVVYVGLALSFVGVLTPTGVVIAVAFVWTERALASAGRRR